MRHALLPSAITARPQGMGYAPPGTRLVALAGLALPLAPSVLRAALVAVNLAAIAAATDEHLRTTANTQKKADRRSVREFGRNQTRPKRARMLPRHFPKHPGGYRGDIKPRPVCAISAGSYRTLHGVSARLVPLTSGSHASIHKQLRSALQRANRAAAVLAGGRTADQRLPCSEGGARQEDANRAARTHRHENGALMKSRAPRTKQTLLT